MIKNGDRVYYKLQVGFSWFTISARVLYVRGKYATIQQSTRNGLPRRMSKKLTELTKCHKQF